MIEVRRPQKAVAPIVVESGRGVDEKHRLRHQRERNRNLVLTMTMAVIWAGGILCLWAVL